MIPLKMNEPVKVSIMGVIYDILLMSDEDIAKELNVTIGEKGGYYDPHEKVLAVAQYNTTHTSIQSVEKLREGSLRHEIVHAFMYESGLWCDSGNYSMAWSMNEEMIDWFAIQSNKIFEVFWKLDIVHFDGIGTSPVDEVTRKSREFKMKDPNDYIVPNPYTQMKDTSPGLDYSKLHPAEIMAEAHRIQSESIGKAYEARRGVGCPVPETDKFDICCGEYYPH